MKKFILFSSFVALIVSFTCCKKDEVARVDFSNYTATDSSGALIGEPDTTDWTHDEIWTTYELSLVKFRDTLLISDTLPGYVRLSPAAPNPNGGLFLVGTDTERECKMKVVIVDEDFRILHFHTIKHTGGPNINFFDLRGLTAFRPQNYYRMYYAFLNAKDSVYYKGHGDLRME